ncbi:MAG: hypothetical protein ACI9VN_002759 [Patescibacteria group bacterium]|jgi:hypothetical protein
MKNSLYLLTFLFLFTSTLLQAGGISGSIKDINGEPLSYATIFIKSQGTGTTTNLDGNYSIRLSTGTYEVIYQYLGYKSKSRRVIVSNNDFTVLNVVLEQEILNLEQVEIIDGRENPAYTIMRKAIAKSSYHIQQLDSYKAIIYMKGSGRIKKVPRIIRKKMEKEGLDTKRVYTLESVSEFSYKRPNTYTEKVISINSKGDANNMSPNQYLNASFYNSKVGESISPLSPKAFGYYKFELEGTFFDQGKMINKIKVTPRSKGDHLFEGFISIVEEEWAIHSLDLNTVTQGIRINIKQIYEPIQDKAWMPVSHTFVISGQLFGLGFEFNYLATASNYTIELNPDLQVEMVVIDETIQTEKAAELKNRSKKQKKKDTELSDIQQKLSDGEEINRKDLRKMMKQYEKQERKESEEPKVESNKTYTVDSLATNRDSIYWADIRSVPLTTLEVRGYKIRDSIAIIEKAEAKKDSTKTEKKNRYMPWDIFFPNDWKLAEGTYIHLGSPLYKLNFNTVEGYNSNYDVHLTKKWENDNRFKVGGKIAYSLARNKVTGKGYSSFDYGKPLQRGELKIEGGQYLSQLNSESPIYPIVNTFMTLLFNDNYMKLYQKNYISLKNDKLLRPNFRLITKVEWAERMHLINNQDARSWVKDSKEDFTSNTPPNSELETTLFNTHKATTLHLGMEYQPWLRYYIKNGVKNVSERVTPTFFLNYNKGIPDIAKSITDFDQVEIGFKHQLEIGIRGKLSLHGRFGHFFNNDEMTLLDYKHFKANLTPFVTTDPVETFRLLDYYNYSTNNSYFIGHSHLQFRKFLATQLVELRYMGIKENLFVNYLSTSKSQNYFEVGYSIDKILRFLRLEFVTSYQNFKYESWGIRIGIASGFGAGVISVE